MHCITGYDWDWIFNQRVKNWKPKNFQGLRCQNSGHRGNKLKRKGTMK